MPLHFQQKLLIPVATHPLVARPSLHARLEAAITTRQMVTLAAPAGWGKTIALAQWAARTSMPVAWYTLDRTDRDPQLFVRYLLHAVRAYVPDAEGVLAHLGTTPPNAMREFLQTVAATIAAAPAPFALILDDAHILDDEIGEHPSFNIIFELLGALIEYAPNCHLVLASRTLPVRQGLARMVVQQRAAIFDYTTLQFQPVEVQQMAQLSGQIGLDEAQAARLTTQLDGWVAGIALALDQAAQHSYDPSNEPAIELPLVYDYFAEQVIAPLPAPLQRFLEDTSVLESLSPQRCDALLGSGTSAQQLNELQHHTLFVSRRGNWLSLHSLFREFLRNRLARNPTRERDMLWRAGNLYRGEDDLERATDAYLAAGALEETIALLRGAAPRYLQHARQLTLLACFERVADAYRHTDQSTLLPPDLLLTQARVFRDLALWQRAELAVQLAERSHDALIRREAQILAADLRILQHDVERARTILDRIPSDGLPPSLQFAHQLTSGRLALSVGKLDGAIEAFERAQVLAHDVVETTNDLGTLATIADNLGLAYAMRGDRAAATAALKHADACWQASGNQGRRTMTLNNLGMLAMEDARYAEARTAFETGRALAQQTGRRREEIHLLASAADLSMLEGQFEHAIAQFAEAHHHAVQIGDTALATATAIGALWAAAVSGAGEATRQWQAVVGILGKPRPRELLARLALAQAVVHMRSPQPDQRQLAARIAEAAASEGALSAIERAALALLRAHVALAEDGWAAASTNWNMFEDLAVDLPDPVVAALAEPHATLLAAAAPASPLAQRYAKSSVPISAARWSIRALGGFTCMFEGQPLALSSLHRALLVRLLDAGPQGVSIERLRQDVWGDDEVSMPALHTALSRLRSQTKLNIAAREGVCAIQSPWNQIDYDVWKLEHILNTPASHEGAQQALAWYRGDFLPGEVPSATLWADARRAQLQQRYLDMLERTAQSVELQAPEAALEYYQHVLRLDPCREQTAAKAMRLAASFGKRSVVVTTYELLSTALQSLGVSPDPAIVDLYSQLQ